MSIQTNIWAVGFGSEFQVRVKHLVTQDFSVTKRLNMNNNYIVKSTSISTAIRANNRSSNETRHKDSPYKAINNSYLDFTASTVTQSPAQTDIDCFQGQGNHYLSGQTVPGPYHT